MGFGFLGNLFSGIGHGIKSGVGLIGKLPGKLNGIGGEEAAARPMSRLPLPGPGGTGGFAGNEGLPDIGGNAGLIGRPHTQPNRLPHLERPDNPLEPIRDSVDILDRIGGLVGGSDALGKLLDRGANSPASVSGQQSQMIPERSLPQIRVPDFLGPKGSTMEDTPMNRARYGYQTEYMNDGHIPRRWQDILANSLHGAAQGFQQTGDWAGALGGAAAGGIGSSIDPLRARNFRFNKEQLPRLEANRTDFERGQDRDFELQKRDAELGGLKARTAATIAGTKDAELERRYRQAQIAKMDAQAEASRLGKPVVKMITDEDTGEIYEAQIYPDGRVERRGLSGTADLRQQGYQTREGIADKQIQSREGIANRNIQSREKIVGMQQGGANYRAGMSQSGQNARQAKRLSAQYGDAPPVGSVPTSQRERFIQQAMDEGYSRAEAEAHANKKGMK